LETRTLINKKTCDTIILNGMVATCQQSNTRKRLTVTLNVHS